MQVKENEGGGWVVIDEDHDYKIAGTFPTKAQADAFAQDVNSKKAMGAMYSTGGGNAPEISAADLRDGCTCNIGIAIPGAKPCPKHP